MVIVLDNARDEQQVRPLLPASQASLVIITSRNQLTGLAVDGDPRAAAEPGAVGEIARLCAHLPLALAVTAARAAARPRFLLTQLAAELRSAPGRLDALDALSVLITGISADCACHRAAAHRAADLRRWHPGSPSTSSAPSLPSTRERPASE